MRWFRSIYNGRLIDIRPKHVRLIFTKGSGKFDRLEILRAQPPAETIECPKQGIIPHDMVHYAVEQLLQKRGFISRVFAGEAAAFQMQAEPESDGVERLVEVFQGDAWSGYQAAAEEMLELYQVTCTARACTPIPVQASDIEAVRAALLALTARWQQLAVGASLTLEFSHSEHA